MKRSLRAWVGAVVVVVIVVVVICNVCGCSDFDVCDADAAHVDALPRRLSDSGLLDDGVIEYAPAFALWSDGAEKRRFLSLPVGGVIDVDDADDWRFPVGTKLWKEFTRDGVRVETRLLLKTGDGDADWAAGAYVFGDDDDDAVLDVDGAVDARGTGHDVPAADRCVGCHGGRQSFVLGFSAVQLANVDADSAFDLDDAAPLLSAPLSPARFRVGGAVDGADREVVRGALGYLHANCAHCHNQARPEAVPRCYDPQNELELALLGGDDDVGAVSDAVGTLEDADALVAGDPDHSELLRLMAQRQAPGPFGPAQMPPLATEVVDDDGVALVRRFIAGLR